MHVRTSGMAECPEKHPQWKNMSNHVEIPEMQFVDNVVAATPNGEARNHQEDHRLTDI